MIPDPRRLPIKRPGHEAKPKKVKVARKHEEDDLQGQIIEMFRLRKADDAMGFSVPNGGYRSWQAAKQMKATGQMPGAPDLVFLNLFGLAFLMEVKARRGSLSKAQKDVRDWCIDRNIPWVMVRTLAEAEAWLVKHGLIRPARPLS
jgi:hypothetical protein